jgi:AGZA family xanthine/uracil permease-like MFS transporter
MADTDQKLTRAPWWDLYFQVTTRRSTLRTEILAGVSLYLSMAYILVVNPAILSRGGFDSGSVLFATAVASGLTCLLMGVWARLPFALAPGLEMNGFVAFSAIGLMGLTVSQALGAVFWSGVLCILLTWLPVRGRIIRSIPLGLQSNLALSVGVFVLTIGLFLAKLVAFEKGLPSGLGSLFSREAVALGLGLFVCVALRHLPNFRCLPTRLLSGGAFIFAILTSCFFCRSVGITAEAPTKFMTGMLSGVGQLDWWPFSQPSALTVFLVLFLIDFYGSIGKFIGLTAATNLRSRDQGVVGLEKAMYVDGIGTVGGALMGTTSIITYVESAIGIHAGGRTGIVAITCGVLMLASLVFTPLVSLVPVVATSGVLVYVGYALLPRDAWRSGEFGKFDLIVGILMATLAFATFSLDKAMLVGFGAYAAQPIFCKSAKFSPVLLLSFALLSLSVIIQLMFS